jgi:hypothetical protein
VDEVGARLELDPSLGRHKFFSRQANHVAFKAAKLGASFHPDASADERRDAKFLSLLHVSA